VLEVGCGPGRLAGALAERALARVWAIDASAEMIEEARSNVPASVGLKVAEAEALPFRDGWFDRAVMRMAVHLVDRSRAFTELVRVLRPAAVFVSASHDPETFSSGYLAPYFPSIVDIDTERFPTATQLEEELVGAGFESARVERLTQDVEVARWSVLERVRSRFISTFDLIPLEEYQEGLSRIEKELPDPARYQHHWLVAVAVRRKS
jgi:ubiquinone/menaquinone biosynthesis C-methylase UbiE